ncbi:hypothetical protein D0Z00_002367 [Geotrichum galactomycetum]|uniref:Uncharacterized protein n=1 Tax=Geotrichum galactomycetum TaxID=27317 RepID=A0ACB6V4B4_9ASCO|nr:hypothetical protein D0Z00_002367 [Geotrichum candidum]
MSSESQAQKVSETVESSEETVTIPKSQIALLYSQINTLAKSVAEKEKLQNQPTQQLQNHQVNNARSFPPSAPLAAGNSNVKTDQSSPRSKHSSRTPSGAVSAQTISPSDVKALLEALPVYSGSVGECFRWWTQQVESFCKTFNLKLHQIEYFIPQQLLKGRALECYRKVQKEFIASSSSNSPSTTTSSSDPISTSTNASATTTSTSNTNTRYKRHLPWKVLKHELAKLDNKLLRSVYIHEQIANLRAPGSKADENTIATLVTKFRKLESQLDFGPLGDRLYLIFQILPESKDLILEKIDSRADSTATGKDDSINIKEGTHGDVFNNVDEVCDFILIHLDELMKSINSSPASDASTNNNANTSITGPGTTVCGYCNKAGHLPSKCFKRKKQRQKEKIKLFDSLQKQHSGAAVNGSTNAPSEGSVNAATDSLTSASTVSPTGPSTSTFVSTSTDTPPSASTDIASTSTTDIIPASSNVHNVTTTAVGFIVVAVVASATTAAGTVVLASAAAAAAAAAATIALFVAAAAGIQVIF